MTVPLSPPQNDILLRTEPIWPQRYHHIYKHYKCGVYLLFMLVLVCQRQLDHVSKRSAAEGRELHVSL